MIELRIICDGCSVTSRVIEFTTPGTRTERGAQSPRAHRIRERLRVWGWLVGQRGGMDYCPACRKDIRRADQA